MNIYKELLTHEVFPALGCTEPIAVAYAAALAAAQLKGEVKEVRIEVDPGVFKNGFAVTVPNTGGEKGNLIAGALGTLIAQPELKMEILKGTDGALLARAKGLLAKGHVTLTYDDKKVGLYIDVTVRSAIGTARAVLEDGHTNLAVNTLVSDLGGMLFDGAKSGCALKVVSSTESAIRAAYMALNSHGITEEDGFVGRSAEETIKNMSRISGIGMSLVDETMLGIMEDKKPLSSQPVCTHLFHSHKPQRH